MIKKIHEGKLQVSFERRKKKERFYEKPKTSSKPKTDLKMVDRYIYSETVLVGARVLNQGASFRNEAEKLFVFCEESAKGKPSPDRDF
jgi:hypothetical protein